MRKLYFYVAVFVGLLIGCNKEDKQQVEGNYVEVVENAISVVNDKGELEALKITFRLTIDAKTEEIISREVSQNLLDVLGLKTQEDFFTFMDKKVKENSGFEYQALNLSDEDYYDKLEADESVSDCVKDCNDKYTNPDGTKRRGRGACKFNCYLDKFLDYVQNVVHNTENPKLEGPE